MVSNGRMDKANKHNINGQCFPCAWYHSAVLLDICVSPSSTCGWYEPAVDREYSSMHFLYNLIKLENVWYSFGLFMIMCTITTKIMLQVYLLFWEKNIGPGEFCLVLKKVSWPMLAPKLHKRRGHTILKYGILRNHHTGVLSMQTMQNFACWSYCSSLYSISSHCTSFEELISVYVWVFVLMYCAICTSWII